VVTRLPTTEYNHVRENSVRFDLIGGAQFLKKELCGAFSFDSPEENL